MQLLDTNNEEPGMAELALRVAELEDKYKTDMEDLAALLKEKAVELATEVLSLALHKPPHTLYQESNTRRGTTFTSGQGRGRLVVEAVSTRVEDFAERANEILRTSSHVSDHHGNYNALQTEVADLINRLWVYRDLENDPDEVFRSSVLILCQFNTFRALFE
jgi:hypothetical protein